MDVPYYLQAFAVGLAFAMTLSLRLTTKRFDRACDEMDKAIAEYDAAAANFRESVSRFCDSDTSGDAYDDVIC